MLFNSIQFAYFFVITTILYFVIPFRFRWLVLLVTGCYFYMCWRWEYIFLIAAETIVNYVCAIGVARSSQPRSRKAWLGAAVVITMGILFFYKYYNFVNESARAVFQYFGLDYNVPAISVILPVGISFHSFQTLGYTIDVYRRKVNPEKHLGYFSLFSLFYPQLIAGPIERAGNLLPQVRREHHFSVERLSAGLKLMLWGMFKKAVIADRLAMYVNQIYNDPSSYSGATLLLATYCFAFQIYCDFSGYTDIAIGAAKILGYDLTQNFRRPYLARSIADFWGRWHISLSTWFRDYLYIPLGGNRVAARRWAFNIMVTFLVSGLWHGASWTYVIWGGLHGFYYLVGGATAGVRQKVRDFLGLPSIVYAVIQVIITFHLALLAWVFFRANSFSDAVYVLRHIGSGVLGRLYLGPSQLQTAISLGLVLILMAVQVFQERGTVSSHGSPSRIPAYLRIPGYMAMVFAILILGVSNNAFIYFQF